MRSAAATVQCRQSTVKLRVGAFTPATKIMFKWTASSHSYRGLPMRRLQHVLTSDATLAEWLARRDEEQRLDSRIRAVLPRALAERVHVSDGRPPELVLTAGGGAAAALVRQRGPEILGMLRREGWEFTSIRVRVQVGNELSRQTKSPRNQLDDRAVSALERVAGTVGDASLEAALRRLAKRGARAPTR